MMVSGDFGLDGLVSGTLTGGAIYIYEYCVRQVKVSLLGNGCLESHRSVEATIILVVSFPRAKALSFEL